MATSQTVARARLLPHSIIAWAALPLPDSFLFHQALVGSDLIDESDLSQWNKAPPYNSPPPLNSPEEARFTQNLAAVMHGQHCRLEKASRVRRARMFHMGEVSVIQRELHAAKTILMENWDELHTYVSHMEGCERHKVMAECYVHRRARDIINYRREADSLAQGQNPYK
jgi:hypothetical protein